MAQGMTVRVGVAIPFFQRQSGLLSRAVRSALAQTGAADPWIVVVDDSSPIPAEDELAWMDAATREKVKILHRPNGGCGNARNTAFDSLPDDIEFAALLDADDGSILEQPGSTQTTGNLVHLKAVQSTPNGPA